MHTLTTLRPPTLRPLGSARFRADHGVRLACVAGGMAKAIASPAMIVRLGRAGILGFLGTGGCRPEEIAAHIDHIQAALPADAPWGVNLLHDMVDPRREEHLIDLLIERGVRRIEAAAFIHVTPALIRWRVSGLDTDGAGQPVALHKVLAKVSHPTVARQFLQPPDPVMVEALLAAGRITSRQAALAATVPLADDICCEADSGGHTDRRPAFTLLPAILRLRDSFAGAGPAVRVGLAGGLGTPEAVAAAFMLGADFVLTGSINQCTAEAGTSGAVKDMLAAADIHDCDIAPAGDMFEIGAKVQVLRRGTLFPQRANRLWELWRRHDGLESLPPGVAAEIEEKYLGRPMADVWDETMAHWSRIAPAEMAAAEADPKRRMALVFRWYFVHANRLAMQGVPGQRTNYQIHCGPAMGACNRWLAGSDLADWRARHADEVADRLMDEAARLYEDRMR